MPDAVTESILQRITEYFKYGKKSRRRIFVCSVLLALTIKLCSQVSKCRIKDRRINRKFYKGWEMISEN